MVHIKVWITSLSENCMGTLTQDVELVRGAQQDNFQLPVALKNTDLDCILPLPLIYLAPVTK